MIEELNVFGWDIDGVLLKDSLSWKDEAWFRTFANETPARKNIVAETLKYLKAHDFKEGIGNRYSMARHLVDALGIPENEHQIHVEMWTAQYEVHVLALTIEHDMDVEDRHAVEQISKHLAMFTNSAAPTASCKSTLNVIGLRHLMQQGIYGKEDKHDKKSKRRILAYVSQATQCPYNMMGFADDSISVYNDVKDLGLRVFFGVRGRHKEEWNEIKDDNLIIVNRIAEIPKHLGLE